MKSIREVVAPPSKPLQYVVVLTSPSSWDEQQGALGPFSSVQEAEDAKKELLAGTSVHPDSIGAVVPLGDLAGLRTVPSGIYFFTDSADED